MATGLNLKFAGGVEYQIDGRPIDFTEHFIYRGMMFSDLPNMAFTVGYTNSSWTLKVDLTANYVCRLLNHMKKHGYAIVMPRLKGTVEQEPFLDFDADTYCALAASSPNRATDYPGRITRTTSETSSACA